MIKSTPIILMGTTYDQKKIYDDISLLEETTLMFKPTTHSNLFETIMNALGHKKLKQELNENDIKNNQFLFKEVKGATILLVEDNDLNQQVATELIESTGCIVEIANNGKEAIEMIDKDNNKYELIFMDIQMPIMNGYTASKRIRANKALDHLPIIAMTADAVIGVKEHCLNIGMNDFISKPINPDEIFAAILKYIKPKQRSQTKIHSKPKVRGIDIDLPSFKHINTTEGLRLLNYNKELYNSLLVKFAKNNSNFIEKVQEAYSSNNQELVFRLIHTMKGISGSLGAIQLYEATQMLEKGAQANIQDLPNLLEEFSLVINPVLKETHHYALELKESTQSEKKNISEKINTEAVTKIFKTLIKQLQENDLEAGDTLAELEKQNGLTQFEQQIKEITNKLEKYDFDSALELTEEIMKKIK